MSLMFCLLVVFLVSQAILGYQLDLKTIDVASAIKVNYEGKQTPLIVYQTGLGVYGYLCVDLTCKNI